MKVILTEKKDSGQMIQLDEREWNESMIAMLDHSNYLLLNGMEYEMLEGRLNVNDQVMEILVMAVKQE